jgi:hypothetical protein
MSARMPLAKSSFAASDTVVWRHDVHAVGIDVIQDRVERGGLSAAGRPGDEDDALGPRDHALQHFELRLLEAELVERHDALLPVEDAQHQVLAVRGRQARAAEIDHAA